MTFLNIASLNYVNRNQLFAYTKRGLIVNDDNCLDAASASGPVKLFRCHGLGGMINAFNTC